MRSAPPGGPPPKGNDDLQSTSREPRLSLQIDYLPGGGHSFGLPKSKGGRRVVPFPDLIAPDLRNHLGSLGPVSGARLHQPGRERQGRAPQAQGIGHATGTRSADRVKMLSYGALKQALRCVDTE